MRSCLLVLVICTLTPADLLAQGYVLEEERMVVDAPDHWNAWLFPRGTLDISDEGWVGPRFMRKNIGAVANARELGGGVTVGSNSRFAEYVLDGDSTTSWAPDIEAPLSDWWIEVDLGRAVSARSIVIRFDEAEDADPFQQFRVFTSAGEPAFFGSNKRLWRLAFRTKRPDRAQRVYEIPLYPWEKSSEEWSGTVLQYVRVEATDSGLGMAEEVTEEEYRSLPPDRQGEIQYHRRTAAGWERPVGKEEYENLLPKSQGSIRYYRWERPRLADIEVHAFGDNVALRLLERGGSVEEKVTTYNPYLAFDGEYLTHWIAMLFVESIDRGRLIADLGATFWVDTAHLVTFDRKATGEGRPLGGYVTRSSDGTLAPDGTLIWESLSPRDRGTNPDFILFFEDRFERRRMRWFEFKNVDMSGTYAFRGGAVKEFQLYGEGYVADVTMTSPLIELGGARNLTTIEWTKEELPGTALQIRTRTGDDLEEVSHFFDNKGNEVTELKYNALPGFAKGEIRTEVKPGAGWSSWSRVYDYSGEAIGSPSPRRFAMIQARFISDDPLSAASLSSLALNFLPPLAHRAVGEISPDHAVALGMSQEFLLGLRVFFQEEDPGFDEIRIEAPVGISLTPLEVRIGSEETYLGGTMRVFPVESAPEEGIRVVPSDENVMWLRLPEVHASAAEDLVLVRFRSALFMSGTEFQVSLGNTSLPSAWQRVDPGDATYLTSSGSLTVMGEMTSEVLSEVEIAPNPFTPNGDGINDVLAVGFELTKVNVATEVEVEILTLDGRSMRTLQEVLSHPGGVHQIEWDGMDADGVRVPPGIYVCRIRADVDERSADAVVHRMVACVY